jgi:Flp pilus assembly secretin CpaC
MSLARVALGAAPILMVALACRPAMAQTPQAEGPQPQPSPAAVETRHLRVIADQATAVRLDQPAKTIVIGNSSVAEAMLVNDRLLYVQGRIFGTTNLLALDSQGREILKAIVTVGTSDASQVTLYRGNAQFTMVCTPRCERTVMMGDADMEIQAKSGTGKMDVAKAGASLSAAP